MGEKLKTVNKHWIFVLTNFLFKISYINKPYVTKTASEFIFDGYEDPILDVVIKLNQYIPIDLPFKRVGWFYGVIYNFFIMTVYFIFKIM